MPQRRVKSSFSIRWNCSYLPAIGPQWIILNCHLTPPNVPIWMTMKDTWSAIWRILTKPWGKVICQKNLKISQQWIALVPLWAFARNSNSRKEFTCVWWQGKKNWRRKNWKISSNQELLIWKHAILGQKNKKSFSAMSLILEKTLLPCTLGRVTK